MSACTTVLEPAALDPCELEYISSTFDENGHVVASVGGDEDCDALYITVGDGVAPADPTDISNDGNVAGRSGTIASGVKITTGKDAYVKVVGYDASGVAGPVRTFRQARRIGPFHSDTSTRSHTGDLVETTLETITVPANTLGTNGGVTLDGRFLISGGNSGAVLRIKFGGTTMAVSTYGFPTASYWITFRFLMFNQGATNSQKTSTTWWDNGGGSNPVAIGTGGAAIDTTVDQDITITVDLLDAGDQVDLELTFAELAGTK